MSNRLEPCRKHFSMAQNYVPCWDKECETLYRSFIQAPVVTDSDRTTSSLLSRLEQKKQEQLEEAVNSSDFSHSSDKAWSTINKLTGRSGPPSRLCPVSANFIASQLVKNGAKRTGCRESTRLASSCPTYGSFQNLRATVSLNPLGRRSFLSSLFPSDA